MADADLGFASAFFLVTKPLLTRYDWIPLFFLSPNHCLLDMTGSFGFASG